MRAETLEPRPAFLSPRPAPQFFTDVMDLFPQKPGRAVTTAGLEFYNRRGHLDDARVEVNRAAGWQLKGTAGARQHFPPNELLGRPENFLRPLANVVDDEAE